MFSESHCHLRNVEEETIKEAEERGFELLLTSGIDLISSELAMKMAKKYGIVKACIGIHPWYSDEWNSEVECIFRNLADNPEVVAISEIGLDYKGRMTKEWKREEKIIDKDIQKKAFTDQIELAKDLGLPILIHDRADGEEVIDILEDMDMINKSSAIHGFSKGSDYASRCVDLGIYLSIGLRSVKDPGKDLVKAIDETNINWLLTETDSGDPTGVLKVCDIIAEIKGLNREEVGEKATRNLKRLLGKI